MDRLNKPQNIATFFIIIAGCCWGVIGLFSRSLSNVGLNSTQISLLRSMVLSVTLLLLLSVTDRKKLRIYLKDIWLFIGSGVLSIAFFSVCYFISVEENTLSLAVILLYTAPSIIIVMSRVFFKEKITRKKLSSLIISFMGCFFAVGIFNESVQTSSFGIMVGLGSGIGYALYSIFSRIALKKYNWITVITYTFLFATIALLPLSDPLEIYTVIRATPSVLAPTLALGWVSTLIPFVLYTKGLEHLEVGKAALLTFVEPLVATMVGVIAFQEEITVFNLGGVLMIILSIIILNVKYGVTNPNVAIDRGI